MLGGLSRDNLDLNPFSQFELWMQQAIASGLPDPTAMTLATVDVDGQPSQRIVLLKHFDEQGFVFYTNYGSSKARDINVNPKVSIHFPWHAMERQVKAIGVAERVSMAETIKYFLSRPRDSQLAAWASAQSLPISSRALLLSQFESMKNKFKHGQVPVPDFWGGYRVAPHTFEFWQGGGSRLHDRFEYRKQSKGNWHSERLAP
ncbi:MAG: pyridoxamine 5'-phosphate oxidase [Lentisphaeria bacterium]